MVNWSGGSKIQAWWVFLAIALLICCACFVSSDQFESLFWTWSSSSFSYWPSDVSELNAWELDTRTNYTAKLYTNQGVHQPVTERIYDFDVSEFPAIIGGKVRSLIGVNKKYPGPLIEAVEGDTIVVRVRNNLKESSTSIHFHGQAMNNTNFYDGAVGVTQCGIPPGGWFEHRFVAEPAGTYWYHSHSHLQSLKGFLGPLIIHHRTVTTENVGSSPNNDMNTSFEESAKSYGPPGQTTSLMPEEDHVLLLTDLYNKDPTDLLAVYREPWLGGDIEPIPGIALAQGTPYSVVDVPLSRPIKLRIINSASYVAFKIQLGSSSKPFKVIEADGTPLNSTSVGHLIVYPAQRYTIVVELDESEWLFTSPQYGFYDTEQTEYRELMRTSSALRTLLNVAENKSRDLFNLPKFDSLPAQVKRNMLDDHYFEPLSINDLPAKAQIEKYVDLSMARNDEGSISGAVNHRIGSLRDKGNFLADILDPIMNYSSQLGTSRYQHMQRHHSHIPKAHTISTTPARDARNVTAQSELNIPDALVVTNDLVVVDLVVRNFDDGFHPVHLHGHQFWIVERGHLDNSSQPKTWDKPLKRDTAGLAQFEYMRLRVVLDNPGVWLLHCHIPWHELSGMRTMVVSQPEKIKNQSAPYTWWKLCH